MTGDPRKFENVTLLSTFHEEAIETAYYGLLVIHPKTLQPLKQKHIPFLCKKSFVEPEKPGTKSRKFYVNQSEESYILKENQVLMNISTRDFSFIAEDHISQIFKSLWQNIKSKFFDDRRTLRFLWRFVLEDKFGKIDEANQTLTNNSAQNVEVKNCFRSNTVRNANMDELSTFYADKKIL